MLSEKMDSPYSKTMGWISCRFSFALLRASIPSIHWSNILRIPHNFRWEQGPVDLQLAEGHMHWDTFLVQIFNHMTIIFKLLSCFVFCFLLTYKYIAIILIALEKSYLPTVQKQSFMFRWNDLLHVGLGFVSSLEVVIKLFLITTNNYSNFHT